MTTEKVCPSTVPGLGTLRTTCWPCGSVIGTSSDGARIHLSEIICLVDGAHHAALQRLYVDLAALAHPPRLEAHLARAR